MGGEVPQGAKSGVWDCEDEKLFCPPVDEVPPFDQRKTVWTCEEGIHPYGEAEYKVWQGTKCLTTWVLVYINYVLIYII